MSIDDLSDDVALAPDTEQQPVDRTAIAIRRSIASVESSLSEFDKIVAGLAELRKKYPIDLVYDVRTTKGMAEAIAHRAAWRDPRIAVEKFRKTAKQPVLALGKDIDARAAWITEQLLEGELPIHEQIKAEEERKAQERAAKEAAEFGRIVKMQEAVSDIAMQAMVSGKTSAEIAARLEAMKVAELDPAVFQEMMPDAVAARAAAITKLEQSLKAAQWDEEQARKRAEQEAAERARRAAEDAERQRIAAEQAEQAKALAELKAKIDRENAELEARAAAFRAEQQAAINAASAATRGAAVEASSAVLAAPFTQDAQEGVVSAGTPAACASTEAKAATASGSGCEGQGAHAEERAPEPDTRPDLNVGSINARLGFTLNREFIVNELRVPGFEGPKKHTNWAAAQWPDIVDALIVRLSELRNL